MHRAASLGRSGGRLPVVRSSAGRPQPREPAKTASAPRPRLVASASAPNGGGEPNNNNNNQPDIDALAAMLSARAAEMRASMDSLDDPVLLEDDQEEDEAPAAAPTPLPPPPPPLPFDNNDPATVAAAEARVLSAVGEGGFQGADFALVQQLGRLSVGRSTTRGGDGSAGPSSSSSSPSSVAAIAYAARFEPGVPYQQPAPVLLKEYLQRPLALNELLAVARLQEVEDREEDWGEQGAADADGAAAAAIEAAARRNRAILPPASAKWRAATAPPRPGEPPIVPLLGYFESPPSASAREALGLPPTRPEDDEEDEEAAAAARNAAAAEETFWLVYRWEGMRPLSWFLDSAEPLPLPAMRVAQKRLRAAARRRRPTGGDAADTTATPTQQQPNNNFFARALRALRRAGPTRAEAALAKRAAFLRAAAAGALAALAHCHGRGVAHGSLGSGCVMVSSAADDALAAVAEEASSSSSVGAGGPFKPQAVRVKLDNFGLATVGASRGGGGGGGEGEESRLAEARVIDLQALGATLAEAFVVGMSCYGGGGGDWDEDEEEEGDDKNNKQQWGGREARPPPPPPARGAALQRLLFQLYGPDDKIRVDPGQDEDRSTLRAYLLQEPSGAYAPLVAFLDEDEGSGWALLAALVSGTTPAALLLSLHARWLKGGGDGAASASA